MPKRKTTEEFIKEAIKIHKDKYSYDRVSYKNTTEKIEIYCKKCNMYFKQTPREHLDGCGCPICGRNRLKSKLHGVGINDLDTPISYKGKPFKFYKVWRSMIDRCYNKIFQNKEPSYIGCRVCEEWLRLSNFKRWFDENYVEGWELDKDILMKNNKIYSPQTCCFLPKEINVLTTNKKKNKSKYGIGVYRKDKIFCAAINKSGINFYLGSFSNESDARKAYGEERNKYINEIAEKYYKSGEITEQVYDALKRYAEEERCG